MFKKIFFLFVFILMIASLVLGVMGFVVNAQEQQKEKTEEVKYPVNLQVEIPGKPLVKEFKKIKPAKCPSVMVNGKDIYADKSCMEIPWIAEYIIALYKWLVSIVAIIAVVAIMWGGIKWITAAGSQTQITSAKDTIFSAIIGLILLVGSYAFLKTINPQLVELKGIVIPGVTHLELAGEQLGLAGNTGQPWCPNQGVYEGKFKCNERIKKGTKVDGNELSFNCIGQHCDKGGCFQINDTEFKCLSKDDCPNSCQDIKTKFGNSWEYICESQLCQEKMPNLCYVLKSAPVLSVYDLCSPRLTEGQNCVAESFLAANKAKICAPGLVCNLIVKPGFLPVAIGNFLAGECVKAYSLGFGENCMHDVVCKSKICADGKCTREGGNQDGDSCNKDRHCGHPTSGRVCNKEGTNRCATLGTLGESAPCDRPSLCQSEMCSRETNKCL